MAKMPGTPIARCRNVPRRTTWANESPMVEPMIASTWCAVLGR